MLQQTRFPFYEYICSTVQQVIRVGITPNNGEKNMNSKNMIKGAFLAVCIIGMMVLPAAAAPVGQAANGNAASIDQGLKDDLWSNHQQYRLQEFDLHVTQASNVIAILDKYSIDTTQMQATLTTISSKRSALETALTSKDKAALKATNDELKTLWEQFRTGMKESVKAHAAAARAAAKTAKTSATGKAGATTSSILSPATASV